MKLPPCSSDVGFTSSHEGSSRSERSRQVPRVGRFRPQSGDGRTRTPKMGAGSVLRGPTESEMPKARRSASASPMRFTLPETRRSRPGSVGTHRTGSREAVATRSSARTEAARVPSPRSSGSPKGSKPAGVPRSRPGRTPVPSAGRIGGSSGVRSGEGPTGSTRDHSRTGLTPASR